MIRFDHSLCRPESGEWRTYHHVDTLVVAFAPVERGEFVGFAERVAVEAEVAFDEVLDEVFLLPLVGAFVERRHEFEVLGDLGVEEAVDLLEGRSVVGCALGEGGVLEGEEVLVAEVFDEGEIFAVVVVDDGGDIETGFLQKAGDGEEEGVVGGDKRDCKQDERAADAVS